MSITVKVVNKSNHRLPEYETMGAAGMDLKANIDESITLHPLERQFIPTGLYIELPIGYEAQIRPRSGLACKHGITLANNIGTVDADYRGQIMVCLINLSDTPFMINPGDRIAQMVVAKHEKVEWDEVTALSSTERGEGGFGSTGKN